MEMEVGSGKEKGCPQLLHLITKDSERLKKRVEGRSHGSSEEKKLELRLGLPGQDWPCKHTPTKTRDESSLLSLPRFSSMSSIANNIHGSYGQKSPSEKQAFSPSANNGSQKRTAPPVVGWPPIRSSRRIIAGTSSSKTNPEESANEKIRCGRAGENGLFVKINMDGVPIGRKVDLHAYDSYQKLSYAVDQLFRGLLPAQKDGEEKSIENVLDGSGEYTLVYEDNEGDRMLVGDVPWNMFVSSVKRLRVLKSSELHAISLGGSKADKMAT